ncbi:MAG: PAS domain-containing protein [Phycisphaerae bacterium]|nr:PAS domain-containing protein [Phycisphaerae bacterium]
MSQCASMRKILVIEDDSGLLSLVRENLPPPRFEVATATTGTQALAWLETHQADLLLLNPTLPDMSGPGMLQTLTARIASIPFFVIAARQDEPAAVQLMQAGARGCVVKDGTLPTRLRSAIEQATTEANADAERAKMEGTIRDRYRQQAALARILPVGLFRTDAQGHFTYVNERWSQMAGLRADEALGSGWRRAVHPDDGDRVIEAWHEAVHRHGRFRLEHRFRLPDGEVTWVFSQASVERNDDGTVLGYVGTTTDITDRKRTEEILQRVNHELRRSNVEMEEFVYSVSHDLQSPLVTIRGFADCMKHDLEHNRLDSLSNFADRIQDATNFMARLIESLLELSRMGRIPNRPEPIAVTDLLHHLAANHANELAARRITLTIQDAMPTVTADAARMEQVFDNLLINAISHGSDAVEPIIEIGAREDANEVLFFVRDNGRGIAPEHHANIFKAFQRLQTDPHGTGVGLAVVRRLVETQGGRVWVESEPGRGATFWVMFPKQIVGLAE